MKKKTNLSWQGFLLKILESAKDLKWLCITLIVFMCVFDWKCGNESGKLSFSIGCSLAKIPGIIKEVKNERIFKKNVIQ